MIIAELVPEVYRYLFSFAANLAAGFSRLVRLVLRACRVLVLARVSFILEDFSLSKLAEHWVGSATMRPFLGPAEQRHFRPSLPVRALRLNTFLCSITNSLALIIQ